MVRKNILNNDDVANNLISIYAVGFQIRYEILINRGTNFIRNVKELYLTMFTFLNNDFIFLKSLISF